MVGNARDNLLGFREIPFVVSNVDEDLERTISGEGEREGYMRRVDCDCCWVACVPANEKLAGDVYACPELGSVAGYVSPALADGREDKRGFDGIWD